MNRKARRNYFSSNLKNATIPKAFWNILRKVSLGRDIQNLVVDGNEPHDQEAITESLNQYFTTIALSILDGRTIDRNSQTKETISTHVFNVPHLRDQDVYKALYTIDASKDTGSDGIPAKALKIAPLHISQVVIICSLSLSNKEYIPPLGKPLK